MQKLREIGKNDPKQEIINTKQGNAKNVRRSEGPNIKFVGSPRRLMQTNNRALPDKEKLAERYKIQQSGV